MAGKTLGHGRPSRMPFLPLPVGHTLSNEAVSLRVPAMGDVDFSRDRAGGLELGFASCAAGYRPESPIAPAPNRAILNHLRATSSLVHGAGPGSATLHVTGNIMNQGTPGELSGMRCH
jgi:hypothetical protein